MLLKYSTTLSKLFRVKQHSEKKPCVEHTPKYNDFDFDGAEFDDWCDSKKGSAVDKLLSSMKRCQDFDDAEFDDWCDSRKDSAIDKLLSSLKRCQ